MDIMIIDLPIITIVGKEGLCTEEKNIVQELWQEANSHFDEVAELAMKKADGTFAGFWGAMSDESMSFRPWTNGFSRGFYLAGTQTNADVVAPEGWVKWSLPARKYLVVDVEPGKYGEIFRVVIDEVIPHRGMRLSGAVCDFTEPATGQNRLFFPVDFETGDLPHENEDESGWD